MYVSPMHVELDLGSFFIPFFRIFLLPPCLRALILTIEEPCGYFSIMLFLPLVLVFTCIFCVRQDDVLAYESFKLNELMWGQMNHFIVKFSPNKAIRNEVCSLGCFILYSEYYIADVILGLCVVCF